MGRNETPPPSMLQCPLRTATMGTACMLRHFSCFGLFSTPWTVACQAPLSMGFSRQEYWSGLPSPPPGDLPDPGIEARSSALRADSLPSEPPGKPEQACFHRLKLHQLCSSERHCSGKLPGVLRALASNTPFLPMSLGWAVSSGSTPPRRQTRFSVNISPSRLPTSTPGPP